MQTRPPPHHHRRVVISIFLSFSFTASVSPSASTASTAPSSASTEKLGMRHVFLHQSRVYSHVMSWCVEVERALVTQPPGAVWKKCLSITSYQYTHITLFCKQQVQGHSFLCDQTGYRSKLFRYQLFSDLLQEQNYQELSVRLFPILRVNDLDLSLVKILSWN